MTPLIWTAAFVIIGGVGVVARLTATFDQVQRQLDQEQGCRCPECDAGGSCARDGAA